jgi:hypothetical protein
MEESSGWLSEAEIIRWWESRRLYKAGMKFSLLLTALPGSWALVAWLITVLTRHKLK